MLDIILQIPTLGIWDSIMGFLSSAMQPLYWAVSGVVVGFYWVWAQVFGPDSGVTWFFAIISLTVVIRTLMIPLFVKQIQSSRNMQLIQPKMKALQEKYKGDRERLGQETMKLYKEEGVNPASSCLPLLIQMPIFLALFRVLEGASNNHPRGYFMTRDPQLVESLREAKLFGARLAGRFWPVDDFGPTQIVALILIVLMTGTMFITQLQLMGKNMPPEAMTGPMAQQQKMMLYMFPVIFAIGGVSMPIGVLFYWLTSNIWTLGQQYLLIRNNPTPGTPAYLAWEDRMRTKGKDPDEIQRERRAKQKRAPKPAPVVPEPADATDEGPKVQRQQVQMRQVRAKTADGKKKVVRAQPKKQSRAKRKR